jgi:sugar phosphate isomerase/epimerase
MKVGVFTVILRQKPLEEALDYLAGLGVKAVEIGAGAYPGTSHCPVDQLLASDRKCQEFLRTIASRGLEISSLSVHGNPIHPNKRLATEHDAAFR